MYCVLCIEIEPEKHAPRYLRDTETKLYYCKQSASVVRMLDLTENNFLEINLVESLIKSIERNLCKLPVALDRFQVLFDKKNLYVLDFDAKFLAAYRH
jgi:hypothetical protein